MHVKESGEEKTGEADGTPRRRPWTPFGMCPPFGRRGHLPRLRQPEDVQSEFLLNASSLRSCAEWIRSKKTGLHSIGLWTFTVPHSSHSSSSYEASREPGFMYNGLRVQGKRQHVNKEQQTVLVPAMWIVPWTKSNTSFCLFVCFCV